MITFDRQLCKWIDSTNPPTDPADVTRYLYNGPQVIEEEDGAHVSRATYVYGVYVDEPVAMTRGGAVYYYHLDDQYNVMAVTNGSATVVERYEYGDFGQPVDPITLNPIAGNPSAIGNPYLFTGRRFDPETGLYYYRTRYLDPAAGRFTTRDTIGIWGDPVNLGNGYTYAGNNPWTLLDPFGNAGQKQGMTWLDWTQGGLDAAGVIPGVGIVPDLANTGVSLMRGNWTDAGMNAFAAIPIVGDAGRVGEYGYKAMKYGDEIVAGAKTVYKKGKELAGDLKQAAANKAKGAYHNAKNWLKSKFGKETAEVRTGSRYVGAGEAKTIQRTGQVPNTDVRGDPKSVFYTADAPVNSASQAQRKYQLRDKPTHRVDVDASRTTNEYGGNVLGGQGSELVTNETIPVVGVTRLEP